MARFAEWASKAASGLALGVVLVLMFSWKFAIWFLPLQLQLILSALAIVVWLFSLIIDSEVGMPYVKWKEEVRFSDGRVVVVEQRRQRGMAAAREAWLTISLPEASPWPIEWHARLLPLVLNRHEGRLYLLACPLTAEEANKYGNPAPMYVAFTWEDGTWRKLDLAAVPEQIHDANLLVNDYAPRRRHLLTLERKAAPDLNGRASLPARYKRIDLRANFSQGETGGT